MSDPNENFQAPPPPPLPETENKAPRPVHLRIPAIVLFALGVLIVIGGFAKFIPGGAGTGAALCFLGALLFGFSFISLPDPSADAESISLGERLAGIFYEPSRIFRYLRSHPNWLAPFLIIGALNAIYTAAFTQRLTPDRIVNYTMDKLGESGFLPPEAIDRQRSEALEAARHPVQRVGGAVKTFVGVFALTAFVSALYYLGVMVFGGRINYWQSLAATFWATLPVVVIQKVVSLIVLYLKDPDDVHPIMGQETLVQDNLGILFTPADHPVLFVAATAIGILSLYGLWLRARGLRYAGYKVSSTAAWAPAVIVWVLWITFAVVITSFFPSFVS